MGYDWNPLTTENGLVRFRCPECDREVSAFATIPMADIGAEVHSEGEVTDTIDVMCDECGEQFLVEVTATLFGSRGRLLERPDVPVSITRMADDADYMEYEPPDDPLRVFNVAMQELLAILGRQNDGRDGGSSMTRMMFAQAFAILEAYLADSMMELVVRDGDARKRLLSKYTRLAQIEVKLIEVEAKPTLVLDKLKAHLRHVSYHNLGEVDLLFTAATGQSIVPKDRAWYALLTDALPRRHDCVHRNGRDVDGTLHKDIDHIYVGRIIEAMREVAWRVDDIARPLTPDPRPPADNGDIPF